ncbi:MAG: hypothetical protein WBG90_01570 [Saonia sp.]
MDCVELNKIGNFEPWDTAKIKELKNKYLSDAVGECLYENEIIKLWEITLFPNERIPFRKLDSNYSWTSLTKGSVISRNANGKINLLRLKKGDTAYWEFEGKEIISDLENIGDNILRIVVVEHKPLFKKTDLFSIKSFL